MTNHINYRHTTVALIVLAGAVQGCFPACEHGAAPAVQQAAAGLTTGAPASSPLVLALRGALTARGYIVQGAAMAFSEGCLVPPCHGVNPSTRYGQPDLPAYPGSGGVPQPLFKLSPGEALVFFGLTPPAVHYFGFQTYLYGRVVDGQLVTLYASLGDATNPMTINTLQTSDPYTTLVAVITTADRQTAKDVVASLGAAFTTVLDDAGVQDAATLGPQLASGLANLEPLPRDALKLGQGPDHDVLDTLLRVTPKLRSEDPAAADAAEAYIATPPAVILRVTPTSQRQGFLGYYTRGQIEQGLLPRKVGVEGVVQEQVLLSGPGIPDASVTLDSVQQALISQHSATHSPLPLELTASDFLDGYKCIDRLTTLVADGWTGAQLAAMPWCAGDTRDAAYLVQGLPVKLQTDDFIMVLGVNHQASGMARYINVAAHDAQEHEGVVSVLHSQLKLSAQQHVQPPADASKFFVVKLARTCGVKQPYCLELPADASGIPLEHPINVAVRAYLNPQTAVGPAYADLVRPRVVIFRKRP